MRVLHFLSSLGIGGTEVMVQNLCLHRSPEWECAVAAVHDHPPEMIEEFRALGVPVYLGPNQCRQALEWADIVNLHWYQYSPPRLSLVLASGKPFVTTLHSLTELPAIPALTICTSESVRSIQSDPRRFVVVPNGVDVRRFASAPRPQQDHLTLTRVCRPSRCAPYFWDVICQILERYSHVRVRIIGNTTPCRHPSDRVEYLGLRRDIPEQLADSDLFIYTPYPDIGSKDLVVMEAAAAGLPCIVSDVASVRDSVVDGRTGFRTPYGSVARMLEKTVKVIEDDSLRLQMGNNAREYAQAHFDVRRSARDYEAVYREVLNPRRGNPAPPAVRPQTDDEVRPQSAGLNPVHSHAWMGLAARWWPNGLLTSPTLEGPRERIRCGVIGPCLALGGAERWILDLISHTGPAVEWLGVGHAFPKLKYLPTLAAVRKHCPIFPGRQAIAALARACDVIVIWGLHKWWDWIPPDARCRTALVSHGSGDWTFAVFDECERADALACVSRIALQPIPLDQRSRASVLYNGVSPKRLTARRSPRELRHEWGVADDHRVLGYLGRFSGEKNPAALVEAVEHLPKHWVGVLVGSGDFESLSTRAAVHCPGRIVLPGPTLDVGSSLRAFDAVLSPSFEEGFCYSLVESWAVQRPTVSTPTGIALEYPHLVRSIPIAASGAEIAGAVEEDEANPEETQERVRQAYRIALSELGIGAFGARWTEFLVNCAGSTSMKSPTGAGVCELAVSLT